MDYVILDSRKRDFQIWISLIQIKTFEKPAPDVSGTRAEMSAGLRGGDGLSAARLAAVSLS